MDFFGNDTNANNNPILKRAFMFLEEGNWERANEFLEKILDKEPENAWAYLGKLMLQAQVHTRQEFLDLSNSFENNINYKRCIRYGNEELKKELTEYIRYIKERNKIVQNAQLNINQNVALANTNNDMQNTCNATTSFNESNREEFNFNKFLSKDFWFSLDGERNRKEFYGVLFATVALAVFVMALVHKISWNLYYKSYGFLREAYLFWLLPMGCILYIEAVNCIKRTNALGIDKQKGICICVGTIALMVIRIIAIFDIDHYRNYMYHYMFLHEDISGYAFTVILLEAIIYILGTEIYAKFKNEKGNNNEINK